MRSLATLTIARAAGIVAFGSVVLFPIYWMMLVSLSPLGTSRTISGLLPSGLSLENYINIFTQRPMALWVGNSLFVATSSALVSLLVGTSAGYVLSRLKFKGSSTFAVIVLLTQMMPATSIVVPMYGLLRDVGLLNTLPGVSLAHMTLVIPLSIWLIKGFFDSIPADLDQSARVDGCTRWGAFRHISLPLAAPGLAAVFIYGFVTSWHEYLFSRTFASSQTLWTAAVGLSSFKGEYFSLFEPQMAAAVVFAFPVIVVFIVLQRHFVSGGLAGGIK